EGPIRAEQHVLLPMHCRRRLQRAGVVGDAVDAESLEGEPRLLSAGIGARPVTWPRSRRPATAAEAPPAWARQTVMSGCRSSTPDMARCAAASAVSTGLPSRL